MVQNRIGDSQDSPRVNVKNSFTNANFFFAKNLNEYIFFLIRPNSDHQHHTSIIPGSIPRIPGKKKKTNGYRKYLRDATDLEAMRPPPPTRTGIGRSSGRTLRTTTTTTVSTSSRSHHSQPAVVEQTIYGYGRRTGINELA